MSLKCSTDSTQKVGAQMASAKEDFLLIARRHADAMEVSNDMIHSLGNDEICYSYHTDRKYVGIFLYILHAHFNVSETGGITGDNGRGYAALGKESSATKQNFGRVV